MHCVTTPTNDAIAMSSHARQRAQQRSIPLSSLELLLDYGHRVPAGDGAEIVHFTRATRRACATDTGANTAAKLRSAYAIVASDGTVITVGHRFRRVGRR